MTAPAETRILTHVLAQLSQLPGVAVIRPDGTAAGDAAATAFFWRNNTGAARDREGRLIRFGIPGQADITGIVRGRRVELEVKTDDGRQRSEQRLFEARVTQAGGIYALCRSAADAVAVVRQLQEAP